MWSPEIAAQLRRRGHDVSAVAERPELRAQPDAALLVIARDEGRALVTDNVRDFRRVALFAIQGRRTHAGLVMTTNSRLPRHGPATIGLMVAALNELCMRDPDLTNIEHWL